MTNIKRFCLIAIVILFFGQPVFASMLKKKEHLEKQYREAIQLEQVHLYRNAREQYVDIINQFYQYYGYSGKRLKQVSDIIPVMLGAIFRLGIVTSKDNFYNTYSLSTKLNAFDDTNKKIESFLLFLKNQPETTLDLTDYPLHSLLLFSRAYNRLGWSSTLLQGTPWKSYVVYPTGDILNMVKLAMVDIEKVLMIEGLPYQQQKKKSFFSKPADPSFESYYAVYIGRLETLDAESIEYQTYSLINNYSKPDILAKIKAKRYFYRGYHLMKYYRSKQVQETIKNSEKFYAFDQIMSDENRPLFLMMNRLIDILGI